MSLIKQKIIIRDFLSQKLSDKVANQKKLGFGANLEDFLSVFPTKSILMDENKTFFQYISRANLEKNYSELTGYQKFSLLVFKNWLKQNLKTN